MEKSISWGEKQNDTNKMRHKDVAGNLGMTLQNMLIY